MKHPLTRILVFLGLCLAMLPASGAELDHGWRLWPDTQASWQNDTLFLPGDTSISALPTNPPTGGWGVLSAQQGIAISLPGTVEEHLAQLFTPGGAPAPAGAGVDEQQRGDAIYRGVSWWWRTFQAPALKPGQRLVLHVRGARLRSEVYVNGRICGYSLLTELPFDADVTSALKPAGGNLLAIRVTNPGGFHDWNDLGSLISWGKFNLPSSHGYGGLDRGMILEVRDPVSVDDLAVLNRPDLHAVQVNISVKSTGLAYSGPVMVSVLKAGKTYWSSKIMVHVPAGGIGKGRAEVRIASARAWSLNNPVLYEANAHLPGLGQSGKSTLFGFRWFDITGLGSDARLRFNGKRIVLRSAISWGYWAPSGLWPTPAMAVKEVAAAKSLGLNCLQSHRNQSKPEVLDLQDREGLLRYEEPGAGAKAFDPGFQNGGNAPPTSGVVDTSGAGGETQDFTERYEQAKVLAMIRRDRSHPSVIIYSLQNEISPNLHSARLFRVLREMQAADPSRTILLKSGDSPQNQVLIQPWTAAALCDDGTVMSAGWLDVHTAGHNAGGYVDRDYLDPAHYLYRNVPASWGCDAYGLDGLDWYRSDNRKEVLVWGEAGGVGMPDSSEVITEEYQKAGQFGYDRAYHERLASVYNKFLTDYGFRSDYPRATDLFQALGNSSYFFWQKAMEDVRMGDVADEIVISGWESTTIDNHTGIVDAHRNFRADPNIIRQATVPLLLIVRPRHYVLAAGDHAVVDVHLVNEVNRRGRYTLSLSATGPAGEPIFHVSEAVQIVGGEVYGQLLHSAWDFPVSIPGVVTLTASLSAVGSRTAFLTRSEKIQVVQLAGVPVRRTVAVREGGEVVKQALNTMRVTPVADEAAQSLVYVPGNIWVRNGPNPEVVAGADDQRLLRTHVYTPVPTTLGVWKGLAKGKCKVELFFAETFFDTTGARDYDLAINGQTVLKNFEPFAAAGGKNKEAVREFTVDAPDGVVTVAITRIGHQNALVNAVRITDSAGKVIARCAFPEAFTDALGRPWEPFALETLEADLPALLERVARGLRLVIWPASTDAASQAAKMLARSGVVAYAGSLGSSGAPWQGRWYFVRRHWLFDGLPAPGAMDWRYQVNDLSSNGLLLTAPGLEVAVGFGESNDPRVGMGAVVVPHGKGQVVLFDLPGLVGALSGDASDIHPVVARRLLLNAIK